MQKINIDNKAISACQNIKFDPNPVFGSSFVPVMIQCDYSNGSWGELSLKEYAPLSIDPAAKVLHYAQEIFEGLKAYKNDNEEVFLFRPQMNAQRFNLSADRMAMPQIPEEIFLSACQLITSASFNAIPKELGSSLYLRPFMIATDPTLGVKPSENYTFLIIAGAALNYFKKPNVKVLVEDEKARAVKGGVGFAKTGGNYAASLKSFERLEELGCDQTLWLDAQENKYIEELSGMNFFAVIGEELHTPAITDTILSGITRSSILELATSLGLKPVESKMSIEELLDQVESGACKEVFACGTAAVITPIKSLIYKDKEYKLEHDEGNRSMELKERLLFIQSGRTSMNSSWRVEVERSLISNIIAQQLH